MEALFVKPQAAFIRCRLTRARHHTAYITCRQAAMRHDAAEKRQQAAPTASFVRY